MEPAGFFRKLISVEQCDITSEKIVTLAFTAESPLTLQGIPFL
jgi:hypothetical protein